MPKYGLISETDANTIEKTLRLIFEQFPKDSETVKVTEVGVYAGETGNWMRSFILVNDRMPQITGVDNSKDGEKLRFDYEPLLSGDSGEVAYKIPDNSQHLIFLDACHCFAHVISDFFSYAPKVKQGGYLAFHDTGRHIKPFKDFQHGDKENPRAYISVRDALYELGLLNNTTFKKENGINSWVFNHKIEQKYWLLIYDEADETNEAGGICVFKKLY